MEAKKEVLRLSQNTVVNLLDVPPVQYPLTFYEKDNQELANIGLILCNVFVCQMQKQLWLSETQRECIEKRLGATMLKFASQEGQ